MRFDQEHDEKLLPKELCCVVGAHMMNVTTPQWTEEEDIATCMHPRKANVLYGYRQDNFVQINAHPVACAALHMQALKESMGEF